MFDVLNASVITSTYIQGTPMSNLTQYKYPMDPTGTNPKNKIIGERHTVSALAGTDFRLIIPKDGPFHKDSVKIKHVATGEFLIPEIDFTYSYYFEGASSTEPYPSIFGGISLLTSDYDGATLELTEYQTLGAEHVLNEQSLITLLTNVLVDPRTTTWDSVTYKPGYWTPDSHLTHAEETVGYGEMVAALNTFTTTFQIEHRILAQLVIEHMQAENDPHNVSGKLLSRMQALEIKLLKALSNINSINNNSISLEGDSLIYKGASYEWTITNYDSFSTYSVSGDFPTAAIEGSKLKITLPSNFPSGNAKLNITRSGVTRELVLNVNGRTINSPEVLFAYDHEIDVSASPTLTSSPYSTSPAGIDALSEVNWQFSMDDDFQNLLVDVKYPELGRKLDEVLPLKTKVYARCRYRGSVLGWSQWSKPITFTTAGIQPPILTITGKSYGVDGQGSPRMTHDFIINGNVYDGQGNHKSTQYLVFDQSGSLIHDSGEITRIAELRKYQPSANGVKFQSDTVISVRVRYRNSMGNWGPYCLSKYVSLATLEITDVAQTVPRYTSWQYSKRTATNLPRPVGQTTWGYTAGGWPSDIGGNWVSEGSPQAGTPPTYTYRTWWNTDVPVTPSYPWGTRRTSKPTGKTFVATYANAKLKWVFTKYQSYYYTQAWTEVREGNTTYIKQTVVEK